MLLAAAQPAIAQPVSIRVLPAAPESARPVAAAIPDLADGELLLQVNGHGEVRTPADRIVITLMMNEQGATSEAAEAALGAHRNRLAAALQAAGLPADALVDASSGPSIGFIGNERYEEEGCGEDCTVEPPARTSPVFASRQLRLTIGDVSKFEAVNRILGEDSAYFFSIDPQLDDDSAGRREAIALAIADARQEAASYAAALGRRIVRTIRIEDVRGDQENRMMTQMMRRMSGEPISGEAIVEADVIIEVIVAGE